MENIFPLAIPEILTPDARILSKEIMSCPLSI
jgi:hypothetical protein